MTNKKCPLCEHNDNRYRFGGRANVCETCLHNPDLTDNFEPLVEEEPDTE